MQILIVFSEFNKLKTLSKDYLREQPDNLKSFNIIAETAQFVNLVYSNITAQNIDLCIQLFETLNEFTVVRNIQFA